MLNFDLDKSGPKFDDFFFPFLTSAKNYESHILGMSLI